MIQDNKNINNKENNYKNKEWILFEEIPDGTFHVTFDCILMYCRNFSDYNIRNIPIFVTEMVDGTLKLFTPKEDLKKASKEYYQKMIKEPQWIEDIIKKIYKTADEYMKFSNNLINQDYSGLSNDKLKDLFKKHLKLRLESHFPGQIPNLIEWTDAHLSHDIAKKIKNKTNNPTEAFTILTTPDKTGFLYNEEIDMHKIVENIIINNEINCFNNISNSLELVTEKTKEMILEHHKKYCWTGYVYVGPENSLEFYLENIKKTLETYNTEEKIKNKIDKITKKPYILKEKKQKIMNELELNEYEKKIVDIAKSFIESKERRKNVFFHGFYAVRGLLTEITERMGLLYEDSHYLLSDEILNFDNKTITKDKIAKRKRYSVQVADNYINEFYTDQEAKKIFEKYVNIADEKDLSNLKLHGQVACTGFKIGKLKIVNSKKDIGKVDEGDIMASIATNPDLLPAMNKSEAIVTDLGGLTCHAAIVSRELKKPCVIGTKNVTKTFKDGDFVIVDANEGYVKKINEQEADNYD